MERALLNVLMLPWLAYGTVTFTAHSATNLEQWAGFGDALRIESFVLR